MTSRIEELKRAYNPHNINVLSGAIDTAGVSQNDFIAEGRWPAAPAVIAVGKDVPLIHREALILFDSLVLEGNVQIEQGAGVRRRTEISGDGNKPSVLGKYSIAMDYVTVHGGRIGEGAGIAHGGRLEGSIEAGAFANISVTIGKDAVLTEGALAFPLWNQPDGVKVPGNVVYVGGPTPRALSRAYLDTDGKDWKFFNNYPDPHPWDRPIRLSGPNDPRAQYLLKMKRYAVEPSKRPANHVSYDALSELGVDDWLKNAMATPENNEITRARWADTYVRIRQCNKNLGHLNEDSQRFGEVAWYSAQIQSEAILVSRLSRILEAAGKAEEANPLRWLVAAQAYILGVYQPQPEDIQYLEKAYFDGEGILRNALGAAHTIPTEQTVSILAFPKETVNSLFLGLQAQYNGEERVHIKYDAADIAKLIGALKHLPQELSLSSEPFRNPEVEEKAGKETRTSHVDEVEAWIKAANPNKANTILLNGGNRVHKYNGLVPLISDEALLVGNDIGGAVVIGEKAAIAESSIRSEQLIAPGYVNGTVEHSVAHTATNEQEPFFIHPDAVVLRAQVHGAELSGYITDSVVTDQSAINGIIAPNSLLVQRDRKSWNYHIGNFAESFDQRKLAQYEQFANWWSKSPFYDIEPFKIKDVIDRARTTDNIEAAISATNSQSTLQVTLFTPQNENDDGIKFRDQSGGELSPRVLQEFLNFTSWWKQSPFADLQTSQVAEIQARISEIQAAKNSEIAALRDEKVREHGEIYRLSPLLQADSLFLDNTIQILKQNGNDELAEKITDLKEGIEAIIGSRAKIISSQASAVINSLSKNSHLSQAIVVLNELAISDKTISVPAWPQTKQPHERHTYEDTLRILRDGIHPLGETESYKYTYSQARNDQTPQQVIAEQLKAEIHYYPEQLKLIAAQLERIPNHISQVREAHIQQAELLGKPRP